MQPHTELIHVSVREARMAVERVLLTCRIPKGYVSAVRDCVLLSQSLGLGGFERLREDRDAIAGADLSLVTSSCHGDERVVSGGGLPAWLVLPTACDLAVADARRRGRADLRIVDVQAADELQVLPALARRYGARATVQPLGGGAAVRVAHAAQPRTLEEADPLLHHALAHGYPFDRARWREIYALSNQALAPDSVVSRRHAGPVVVDDQGRVVGRVPIDDETDLRTLTNVN